MIREAAAAVALGTIVISAADHLRTSKFELRSSVSPVQGSPASRVDEIFKEFAASGSPGCTVGAYKGGQIVHKGAYGMANLDHDVRLTPASVFHAASVSKQFTATAILLLAADGKLSLDDEVRKFIPELPDFGERITIRHLAHHTSGIRDQWDLLGLAGWRYSRDLITDDDVLQMLSRQKDVNFKPGERHLYSNSGYTLMAIIVSRASGQSFRQFTTDRIFKPLGMVHTEFRDNFNRVVKGQAYGYARDGAGFRLSVTNFDTAGATSLMTTVEDLAKWNAQFDTPIVGGQALLTAMLSRGLLNDGRAIDYAVGISHGTYRGVPTVGHGGADAGYRAVFLRFPVQRFGVAVLCNLASTNPTQLAQRVADIYLDDVLQPAPTAQPDNTPEVPVTADELTSIAGLYWNAAEVQSLRIVVQDGRLHAAFGTPVPLKSIGGGRFVAMTGAPVRATFDLTNGRASRVTISPPGAPNQVLDRVEAFAPSAAALAELAGTYRSDEIEPPYRMVVKDGTLRLERLKAQPASLAPLVLDTFTSPLGIVRFVRDGAGRVTGFVLDGGRVRRMKFSRVQ
jgi:CubicO group peptidase (beta-lactamase class C family)